MNIDLQDSLAQLARSVGDKSATARITGQVHHMVSRVRRRRATRYAAQGAVGIGAVTAVAFGGIQLAGRTGTQAPPITQDPVTGDLQSSGLGQCGAAVKDLNPGPDLAIGLSADIPALEVADGPPIELGMERGMAGPTVTISFTGVTDDWQDTGVPDDWQDVDAVPTLVVVADGVVVSGPALSWVVTASAPPHYPMVPDLTSCETGEPLPAGDYEFWAGMSNEPDGSLELLGGPWPFTITEAAPTPDPAGDLGTEAVQTREQLQAQQEVDAILAEAATWGVDSPACGWTVEPDPASPLTLTVRSDAGTFPAGQFLELEADLTAIDGAHVIGNAGGWAARLVLARDGVVVGATYWDPEDVTLVDVGPDSPVTLPLLGGLNVCSRQMTDAFGPALPPGTYQAHAVLEVMLKEVTTADGEATSRSDLVRAVSAPFDLTVTAP